MALTLDNSRWLINKETKPSQTKIISSLNEWKFQVKFQSTPDITWSNGNANTKSPQYKPKNTVVLFTLLNNPGDGMIKGRCDADYVGRTSQRLKS